MFALEFIPRFLISLAQTDAAVVIIPTLNWILGTALIATAYRWRRSELVLRAVLDRSKRNCARAE